MSLASGKSVTVTFTPHLVPVSRGICTTTYAALEEGVDDAGIAESLGKAYSDSSFVRVLGAGGAPDSKNVVGTNFVDVGWAIDGRTNRLVLMSCEDNILKGASGQAVQSFNLMTGCGETAGLL